MTPAEYLRARAKIESEYRNKLRSLDEVWSLITDNQQLPEPLNGHADAVQQIRGAWRLIAQQVIDEIPGKNPFTVKDIERGIAERAQRFRQTPSHFRPSSKSRRTPVV